MFDAGVRLCIIYLQVKPLKEKSVPISTVRRNARVPVTAAYRAAGKHACIRSAILGAGGFTQIRAAPCVMAAMFLLWGH